MALEFSPAIAENGKGSGDFVATVVATCECGGTAFQVFQIVGTEHPHLQCVDPVCQKSYCPTGGGCPGTIQ